MWLKRVGGFSSTAEAAQQAITLANVAPIGEAVVPTAGMMDLATRADHQHPRLTSSTNHTLDANGFVTITFTRTFVNKPAITTTALGIGTGPIPDFRVELLQTGALWTGATIYGQRNRALPIVAPASGGIILLSGLITAINSMFASMSGFLPYEAASGAEVSVIAIVNSGV